MTLECVRPVSEVRVPCSPLAYFLAVSWTSMPFNIMAGVVLFLIIYGMAGLKLAAQSIMVSIAAVAIQSVIAVQVSPALNCLVTRGFTTLCMLGDVSCKYCFDDCARAKLPQIRFSKLIPRLRDAQQSGTA